MSRWSAYTGAPVFLEDVIHHTGHALATPGGKTEALPVGADGFGIAWYGTKPLPGQFRDTRPDWTDPNLVSLLSRVQSDLVLASVCTASRNRHDCHPFAAGQWSFMLNGEVGNAEGFRADVDRLLPESVASKRKGTTGGEALFLLALAEGLDQDPRSALERAIAKIMLMDRAMGEPPRLRMAAALSDGQRIYTARYATEGVAPRMYHRWSDQSHGRFIASEPVALELARWQEVPAASFCTFDGRSVQTEEFLPYGLAVAA